jgi:hypothetical protein
MAINKSYTDFFYNLHDLNEEGSFMSDHDLIKKINRIRMNKNQVPVNYLLTNYVLPKNTILYHGTLSHNIFNPTTIKFNNQDFIAFFSTIKDYATEYIASKTNKKTEYGYIHQFTTKHDIPHIAIVSKADTQKDVKRDQINGLGFYFKNNITDQDNINSYCEFALLNPNHELEYINTEKCIIDRNIYK